MRKKLFIWQIKFLSCLVIVGLVCIVGCGLEDHGWVAVHNMTDQNIIVYYDILMEDGWEEERQIEIKPNQVAKFAVMIDNYIDGGFCDGFLRIKYNGRSKGYDLDFDLFSRHDTVKVKTKHFL
jgi:hypothetical protein